VNFILHGLGYRYVILVILISKDILKKCNDFICVFNKHNILMEFYICGLPIQIPWRSVSGVTLIVLKQRL
jgi:hypothetical protein